MFSADGNAYCKRLMQIWGWLYFLPFTLIALGFIAGCIVCVLHERGLIYSAFSYQRHLRAAECGRRLKGKGTSERPTSRGHSLACPKGSQGPLASWVWVWSPAPALRGGVHCQAPGGGLKGGHPASQLNMLLSEAQWPHMSSRKNWVQDGVTTCSVQGVPGKEEVVLAGKVSLEKQDQVGLGSTLRSPTWHVLLCTLQAPGTGLQRKAESPAVRGGGGAWVILGTGPQAAGLIREGPGAPASWRGKPPREADPGPEGRYGEGVENDGEG